MVASANLRLPTSCSYAIGGCVNGLGSLFGVVENFPRVFIKNLSSGIYSSLAKTFNRVCSAKRSHTSRLFTAKSSSRQTFTSGADLQSRSEAMLVTSFCYRIMSIKYFNFCSLQHRNPVSLPLITGRAFTRFKDDITYNMISKCSYFILHCSKPVLSMFKQIFMFSHSCSEGSSGGSDVAMALGFNGVDSNHNPLDHKSNSLKRGCLWSVHMTRKVSQ